MMYAVRKKCGDEVYCVLRQTQGINKWIEMVPVSSGGDSGPEGPVYAHSFDVEEEHRVYAVLADEVELFDTIEDARRYVRSRLEREIAERDARQEREWRELISLLRGAGCSLPVEARTPEHGGHVKELVIGRYEYYFLSPDEERVRKVLIASFAGGTEPLYPKPLDWERATAAPKKQGDIFAYLGDICVPFENSAGVEPFYEYLGKVVRRGDKVFFRITANLGEARSRNPRRYGCKICFRTSHLG